MNPEIAFDASHWSKFCPIDTSHGGAEVLIMIIRMKAEGMRMRGYSCDS